MGKKKTLYSKWNDTIVRLRHKIHNYLLHIFMLFMDTTRFSYGLIWHNTTYHMQPLDKFMKLFIFQHIFIHYFKSLLLVSNFLQLHCMTHTNIYYLSSCIILLSLIWFIKLFSTNHHEIYTFFYHLLVV